MSSSTTSSHTWNQLPWLHTILYLIIFTILHMTSVSCSTYSDHCDSIVSESTPTSLKFTDHTFLAFQNAYYRGGDRILNPFPSDYNSSNFLKHFRFRIRNVHETDVEGVFKVEGSVTLRNRNRYFFLQNFTNGLSHRDRSRIGSMSFSLHGYWSESSGKLCMVGSGSAYSKEGNLLHLGSVFKLNYVKKSSIFTSLVTGTLESTSPADDSNYFEPISVFGITKMDYEYSLVSMEFDKGCSGGSDVKQSLSLSSQPHNSLCSILLGPVNQFELKYESDCHSAKNCTPFSGGDEFFPIAMSLNAIQCSGDNQRMRVLAEFRNTSYFDYPRTFNPNITFVGEGLWDGKKNQLCVVACRILNTAGSLADAQVGDCSIKLCLRLPAIWSIKDRSSIVGELWTDKTSNDSDYFKTIFFRSSENHMREVPGLKYEYTEIDTAQKSCPAKKKDVNKKGERYPSAYSSDMRFDISVKNSKRELGWGYSVPLYVGEVFYDQYSTLPPANSINNSSHINISYKIELTLPTSMKLGGGMISAEGVYDAETGSLCMIGCRHISSNNMTSANDSMDCKMLVNFQFPSTNSKNDEGYINGSIESTRKKSDPLFFEQLSLSSAAYVSRIARESIWRMDLEIVMALISNTLACVFVGLQLFYVKKHPDMLLFTSLLTLVILTLGYMTPLVLNFEALFFQKQNYQTFFFRTGGWVEVNEVIVRVFTLVAFLLQSRLLQLTWSAKFGDGSQKDLWTAEKKTFSVSLPLYVAGGLIALFVNWRKNHGGLVMSTYQQHSLWGVLKSYGGLVLDGFLLPQILLNLVRNLREKPLSCSFYIGTTFVRLLPHAYDLYRAHSNARNFEVEYIYADPAADFFSTAWDVVIPLGGLLFAIIIYLQQRFGGRCIPCQGFRQLEVYEEVPVEEYGNPALVSFCFCFCIIGSSMLNLIFVYQ